MVQQPATVPFRQLIRLAAPLILASFLLDGTAAAEVMTPTDASQVATPPSPNPFDQTIPNEDALAIPVGNIPELQLFGALDLNANYDFGGGQGSPSDFYSQATLQLGARYNSRKTQLYANYSLTGSYYASNHGLNQYVNNLNLASSTEVIPEHLILNVSGFAAPTLLNRTGAISASGQLLSPSNTTNTYGYSVEPEFFLRFRDILNSVTTASYGQVFFVYPSVPGVSTAPGSVSDQLLQLLEGFGTPKPVLFGGVQNSSSINASQRIASGDYFGRFNWALTGTYTKQDQQSFSDTEKDGTLDLAYALDRSISVLGTGGYSQFTATIPLSRDLSGPIYMGGFSLTPSESFKLTAEGGVRNRFATYTGSLTWNVSPVTAIDGNLTDSITTPQGSILAGLPSLSGALLSAASLPQAAPTVDQALNPQLSTSSPYYSQGLALQNAIYHDRQAHLNFSQTDERNSYMLSFHGELRDLLTPIPGLKPKSSLYGVDLSLTRKVRQDLTSYLLTGYSYADEFNGRDKIFNATLGAAYHLTDTFSVYAEDRYLHRDMKDVIGVANIPLSDDVVTVGIRIGFGSAAPKN